MQLGIYESLITESLKKKLDGIDRNQFYIADDKRMDSAEAAYYLCEHLGKAISNALKLIKVENKEQLLGSQIEVANNILQFLTEQINAYEFQEDLIDAQGHILEGILEKLNSKYTDVKLHLSEIMPITRLTQSELFTGGNVGISLDSELKKEIRSADRINLLVSFIKWKAVVILKDAFQEFVDRGGQLRIITTTYMGASDAKAIDELHKLANTQIKVSYNNSNERLHAKAYLFFRNTGYHTGYIGSSNFSRSALTDGLEWNVKVTTKEIPHIIDKFQKTFESYWNNAEFELYDDSKLEKLNTALNQNKLGKTTLEFTQFFDLKPYHYQNEILEKLTVERTVHQSYKNLVVAATGTGKTMISAFDFKNYRSKNPQARFLFIAHRIEILKQSLHTFRNVLKYQNFGELLGDGHQLTHKNAVFATVQTFNNLVLEDFCNRDFYDFIVLDEVHHASANTYQKIIQYFTPKILLGLTATPERMDGKSILDDFNFRIAAEIRLPDALNNKLLCPFQYFGVTDSIDYSNVKWNKGHYDIAELTQIYTSNDLRVSNVLKNLEIYTKDIQDLTCIGFCVSIDHAKYMHEKLSYAGLKSAYLVSENSQNRSEIIHKFKTKEINYLFVVDIFNEGVDIPEIDTVLFLRPTESLTIFLQQLGRGLRLHDGKEVLTVLDFVGQSRDEYDYETKFRSLIGKTNTTVAHELEKDFPHLPLGCSIVLEKKAKDIILENIKKATNINSSRLVKLLQSFASHTNAPLTLSNFLKLYNLKLAHIYKYQTFSIIKEKALGIQYNKLNEERYKSMMSKKWMVTESLSYFKFILSMISVDFDVNKMPKNKENQIFALMLYYDFYQKANEAISLENALLEIGKNKDFVAELKEFLEVKIDQISFEEFPMLGLNFPFPLQIHARYTREQILVALQLTSYQKQSSNIAGVALNKALNTEVLFVNLKKSEEDFSPTTMYDDYAISENLFHWQSQNKTSPESEVGISYIKQKEFDKNILLFVRESKNDADGFTQGYVFLGPVQFVDFQGSKPMSIQWKLGTSIPNYLWKETAKMMVG